MTEKDLRHIAAQIDDSFRIGRGALRLFADRICIGMTPTTFNEMQAVTNMRGVIYNNATDRETTFLGFPVKVMEQYNSDGTRGAWLMIDLETEALP